MTRQVSFRREPPGARGSNSRRFRRNRDRIPVALRDARSPRPARATLVGTWLAFLGVVAHCACTPMVAPQSGFISTPGVTIRGVDQPFAFSSDTVFRPPFADKCPQLPIDSEGYRKALDKYGGHRVAITYPGLEAPLNGILLLCAVPKSAIGPGARRYQIVVPPDYVAATDGGRISVVYEVATNRPKDVPSWVLWLSRLPFPE